MLPKKSATAIEHAIAPLRRRRKDLPPHRYRNPDVGPPFPTRAIEFRRDADDGVGIRIQADRFADDWLRAKLLAPQAFADDRHRIRAFDLGFGGLQQSSLRRSDAEYIEVIARDHRPHDEFSDPVSTEMKRLPEIRRDGGEGRILVA